MLNPNTILVVEDNELLSSIIADLLQGEGYQVCMARNGLEGYLSYKSHRSDTVVTDIEMPELDGFEMMRCIRTVNPSVNTIYMSGATAQYRRALAAEAQKFGAFFLRKPFAGKDLLKLISLSSKAMGLTRLSKYERSFYQKRLLFKEAV